MIDLYRVLVVALLSAFMMVRTPGLPATDSSVPPVVFAATDEAPATPIPSPTVAPAAPPAVDEALAEAGRQAYLANYCGVCHTLAAAETTGTFGPSHDHLATSAAQRIADGVYKGAAKTAADYILESIVTPSVYFVPGSANGRHPMPPYDHLDKADLDALVYFLMQQQ